MSTLGERLPREALEAEISREVERKGITPTRSRAKMAADVRGRRWTRGEVAKAVFHGCNRQVAADRLGVSVVRLRVLCSSVGIVPPWEPQP